MHRLQGRQECSKKKKNLGEEFQEVQQKAEEGNEYSLKDKNKAKTDKTEHGNGMSVKNRSRRHITLFRGMHRLQGRQECSKKKKNLGEEFQEVQQKAEEGPRR
ncbi:hypothetical protein Tco_0522700 [Tanacetum coccineum]